MNFEGLAIKCWSKKEMRTIYGIALSNNLPMHPSLKDPATPLPKLGKYDALYFRFGPDNYGFYLDDGDAKVVEFEDFIAAHKKPNPFENVAVKCNTFDEIQELAKIAEGMGLDVRKIQIDKEQAHFRYSKTFGYYSNWNHDGKLPVITYSDFIASLQPSTDPVNRPSHYTSGKIEVIDFIEDQQLGYHLGNVVKYVARAGKKDPSKEVQDLEKARWYLDRLINKLKNA